MHSQTIPHFTLILQDPRKPPKMTDEEIIEFIFFPVVNEGCRFVGVPVYIYTLFQGPIVAVYFSQSFWCRHMLSICNRTDGPKKSVDCDSTKISSTQCRGQFIPCWKLGRKFWFQPQDLLCHECLSQGR